MFGGCFFLHFRLMIILVILIGLLFGSFANVCIMRWPRGGSVFHPVRSHCPWCNRSILWYENIPLLSYLFLLGRCRGCAGRISIRYPIVELLVPMLWVAGALSLEKQMSNPPLIFLFSLFFFLFIAVVTTFIDLDWRIIPDLCTVSLLLVGLLTAAWNPIFSVGKWGAVSEAIIGAVVSAAVFTLLSLLAKLVFGRDGIGWGDVKLLTAFGAYVGWKGSITIFVLASFLGGLPAIMGLIMGKIKRHQYVPFGPFLNVAAILYLWVALVSPGLLRFALFGAVK